MNQTWYGANGDSSWTSTSYLANKIAGQQYIKM